MYARTTTCGTRNSAGFQTTLGTGRCVIGYRACDTVALTEARLVFTNSAVVGQRLRDFNQVDSEVLYPPILHPERFSPEAYNDEIVYVSRLFPAKRQHLLVEALAHTKTSVRVRLVGTGGAGNPYAGALAATIKRLGLGQRVTIDDRWVDDADKESYLNNCLASAYFPIDEDSYGYPTLEAAHAHKATLTTTDSGGVLEFAIDNVNAEITAPEPAAIAAAMDRLFDDSDRTRRLGAAANRRIAELGISWDHVLERLLS